MSVSFIYPQSGFYNIPNMEEASGMSAVSAGIGSSLGNGGGYGIAATLEVSDKMISGGLTESGLRPMEDFAV